MKFRLCRHSQPAVVHLLAVRISVLRQQVNQKCLSVVGSWFSAAAAGRLVTACMQFCTPAVHSTPIMHRTSVESDLSSSDTPTTTAALHSPACSGGVLSGLISLTVVWWNNRSDSTEQTVVNAPRWLRHYNLLQCLWVAYKARALPILPDRSLYRTPLGQP